MSEMTARMDQILQEKCLRRADITKATGINEATIRGWIRGTTPNAEAAIKVADFLNVSVEWLVCGKETDLKPEPQFSKEEQDIIKVFRTLNERDKEFLLLTLKNLSLRSAETSSQDK